MNKNRAKLYIVLFIIHIIKVAQCKVGLRQDNGTNDDLSAADAPPRSNELQTDMEENDKKSCWIPLKGQEHFKKMKNLERKYQHVREAFARDINPRGLDDRMLAAMKQTRGIAERALQNFGGNETIIPAGLNLGGNCLVRMPGSIMFFYRLKLRNNTRFVVNYIGNDMEQLTLTLRLSLNDLHLVGEYERALTSKEDPSRLYYRPTKGGVEFLLKDVRYKVEGRYRLLGDRLHIEHIISEIPPMKILMRYSSDAEGKSTPMDPDSIKDYLQRMKNDLDLWLKDYLNDYLMLYGVKKVKKNDKMQEFENKKIVLLNQYSDEVIDILNKRLRTLGAASLMMPDFMLTAANGMEIKLFDGAVRNVDSMYRRSVTTGKLAGKVRKVDADIGFSALKVEYRYDTYTRTGLPPLSGMLVLNSDAVAAHMALQVVEYYQGTEDLLITYLRYGKPETLTVEGPANRIISNFKHLLEHHIISIMTTAMIHHIRTLSYLVKCEPELAGKDDPKQESEDYLDSLQDNDKTPPSSDIKEKDSTLPQDSKDADLTPASQDDKSDDTSQLAKDSKDDSSPSPQNSKDEDLTQSPQDDKSDDTSKLPQDSKDEDLTQSPQDDKSDDTSKLPQDSKDEDLTQSPQDDKSDDTSKLPQDSKDEDLTQSPQDDKSDDTSKLTQDSKDEDLTQSPQDDKSDDTSKLPQDSKDEDLTQPPQDDKSDDTSKLPQESKDAELTQPSQDDKSIDSSKLAQDNSDDDDHIESLEADDPHQLKADYAFARKESIELELPPKPGSAKGETLKIDHNETFTLTKLNADDVDRAKLRSGVVKAPGGIKGGQKNITTSTANATQQTPR